MNVEIDFGNILVGIGTILIGIAKLRGKPDTNNEQDDKQTSSRRPRGNTRGLRLYCKVIIMKKLDSSILIILAIIVITYFTAGIVKILLGIATIIYGASVLIKTERNRR